MFEKIDLDVTFLVQFLKGHTIGFGGKLGSGKTFVSECLIDYIKPQLPPDVKIVRRSFADGLRDFIENNLQIPVKQYKHNNTRVTLEDISIAFNNIKAHLIKNSFKCNFDYVWNRLNECTVLNDVYRFVLQYIGTEIYRMQVDMDYQVKLTEQNFDANTITIIDDVRFQNELDVIKRNGISAYSIVLNSPPMSVTDLANVHASETSIHAENFEVMFYNLIGTDRYDLGKSAFNVIMSYYYVFKIMDQDPNKEKILRDIIKNA